MNNKIEEEAFRYVKANKKLIKDKFVGSVKFNSNNNPIFMFMAGSPGAGKTEFSKNLIQRLENKVLLNGVVRIDADEIREMLPGYEGKNSYLFQKACSKGVEMLFDFVLKKKYNTIIDGTFSHFNVAHKNVKRIVDKGYKVYVVYKYFDPAVAWGFTNLREKEEGRKITKQVFIDALFKAKENVNRIKEIFGDKVEVWLVESILKSDQSVINEKIHFNINNIDNYLKIKYNIKDINEILK